MAKDFVKIRRDLVFRQAGYYIFIPYKSDNTLDYEKAYNSRKGVVTTIGREFTLNTTDLPDGNSQYPAATYITTQEGTTTIGMSTYDPELESVMAGADFLMGDEADTTMWGQAAIVVPETERAVYIFPEDMKPVNMRALMIEDIYGQRLVAGSSSAELEDGQFFYNEEDGTLTVYEGYKGQTLYANYTYTGKEVVEVAYKENPRRAVFQVIIVGNTVDKDESTQQRVNIVFDRCAVTGSITPPEQSNDPSGGWSMTINVLKPREGRKPVDIKFEGVAAN